MHWLATLNGNSIILSSLDKMKSPHFSIFQDSDDHQAEQFFLRSNHFKGVDDAQQVYSSVCGLIQLVNGASAIHWGFNDYIRRGSIKLDELYFSNEEYPSDSDWTSARFKEEILPSNPFIGEPIVSRLLNPFSSATTGYIELCIDNEDVFNILRQISVGLDWRNLYCIWDTVSHYSGGVKKIIKDLNLDESQIKAFTGTANNFGILGVEARHGVMGWEIPKNTVNYEQAVSIVNDVVVKYLKNKVCLGCKSKEWEAQFN
ncbi:hypothetical protein [Shewanella sp. GD04112]|uniref:hypothetical protein n=1 Tax=Shewanella sp. GD04112 TaxID=2975434 RepID=UPI00244C86F6|nr:hypothetical protein [Shewanella sp. GD04112]MDH0447285.1 hypothetical protein [Shewanella sp. GD04112]